MVYNNILYGIDFSLVLWYNIGGVKDADVLLYNGRWTY